MGRGLKKKKEEKKKKKKSVLEIISIGCVNELH